MAEYVRKTKKTSTNRRRPAKRAKRKAAKKAPDKKAIRRKKIPPPIRKATERRRTPSPKRAKPKAKKAAAKSAQKRKRKTPVRKAVLRKKKTVRAKAPAKKRKAARPKILAPKKKKRIVPKPIRKAAVKRPAKTKKRIRPEEARARETEARLAQALKELAEVKKELAEQKKQAEEAKKEAEEAKKPRVLSKSEFEASMKAMRPIFEAQFDSILESARQGGQIEEPKDGYGQSAIDTKERTGERMVVEISKRLLPDTVKLIMDLLENETDWMKDLPYPNWLAEVTLIGLGEKTFGYGATTLNVDDPVAQWLQVAGAQSTGIYMSYVDMMNRIRAMLTALSKDASTIVYVNYITVSAYSYRKKEPKK